MDRFHINVGVQIDMYVKLRRLYRENHRHYHNFSHIEDCLITFDQVSHLMDYPHEVELALWFHDAIYDPTANKTNELNSAFLAEDFLKKHNVDVDIIDRVWDLIMVTFNHSDCKTNDEKIMIDIDLSILGKSEKEYDEYDKQIKEEYKWVHPIIFKRERKRILEKMLNMKNIYKTKHFKNLYENNAKINLKRSISQIN